MNKVLKYSIVLTLICCVLVLPSPATPLVKKKYVSYFENGKIKERGAFKDGKKHGIWWSYYEDGTRKTKEKHKNGVRIYLFEYNKKGLMIRITNKKGVSKEVTDCGC